jgi:PAS domain S-box-containing protein
MDELPDVREERLNELRGRWAAAVASSSSASESASPALLEMLPALLRELFAMARAAPATPGNPAAQQAPAVADEAQRDQTGAGRLSDLVMDLVRDVVREHDRRAAGERAADLRRDEELRVFRAVVEASPDFIAFGTPEGRPSYLNPAALRLVGLPNQEAARENLAQDFFTPATRDTTMARMMPVVAAGQPFRGDHVLRHFVTGEEIPVSQVAFTVNDAAGRPIVLATIIHDQREQRRIQENLRAIGESIPQQVWTAQPDGNLDFVSRRTIEYYEVAEEMLLGQGWQSVVHPDDLPHAQSTWMHSIETGGAYEVEFRLRRGDGVYRWHLARALPLRDGKGCIVRWFGTCTDIDDAKRTSQETERRAEFEKYLAGIVSHDLRNPLGAILIGAANLLRMPNLPEPAKKAARRIHSATERASRMIRDLLDFTEARLGGGIRVEHQPADLFAVATSTIEEVRAISPDRTLDVSHVGNTCGAWDTDRIAQVVTNLVSNALAYSPAESPVGIRVEGRDGHVELAIHNEGPPIPRERLGRIFEPLQRAIDPVNRTPQRSVGLGLYIVNAIVRAHGGTVDVLSEEGLGTTFTVCLPREHREQKARSGTRQPRERHSGA